MEIHANATMRLKCGEWVAKLENTHTHTLRSEVIINNNLELVSKMLTEHFHCKCRDEKF